MEIAAENKNKSFLYLLINYISCSTCCCIFCRDIEYFYIVVVHLQYMGFRRYSKVMFIENLDF